MTLTDWIHFHEAALPEGMRGFRLPKGRVVWENADFPDRSNGSWVKVYRIVKGRSYHAYYDRDTPIVFVPFQEDTQG